MLFKKVAWLEDGKGIENQAGHSNGNLQPVIDPERDG